MADDSDDWKFGVDEVGPDADETVPVGENGHGDGEVDLTREELPDDLVEGERDEDGNVAGSLTSIGPIEPETPSLENAVFVLLGVYLGVLAVLSMIAPSALASPVTLLVVTGGVLAVGLLSLGFFGVLTPDT